MSRDPGLYLDDIVVCSERIADYVRDCDFDAFQKNQMLIDAVCRNLITIGEAVKKLPDDLRNQSPETRWKDIAGMRDIITHSYFSVDEELVWDVAVNHVPALLETARQLRDSDPSGGAGTGEGSATP